MTNLNAVIIDRTPPEWVAAREYVIAHEKDLRKKYGSHDYLAVTPEGIIDSDEDRYNLARRMEIAHKRGSVYPFPLIASIDEVIHPRLLELPEREFIIRNGDLR